MPGRLSSAIQWIGLDDPCSPAGGRACEWGQAPARGRPGSPVEILFVVFRVRGAWKGLASEAGLRGSGDKSAYDDGKTCHHLRRELKP